jgi:antibiotic biosynthesis monooxygenase (ABM) superfamily enzyme
VSFAIITLCVASEPVFIVVVVVVVVIIIIVVVVVVYFVMDSIRKLLDTLLYKRNHEPILLYKIIKPSKNRYHTGDNIVKIDMVVIRW